MVFGSVASIPAQQQQLGISTSASGGTTGGTATSIAPTDHCVTSAGNDGISSARWSPSANILVSTNWDGGVRCWEVQESQQQVRALPKAQGESSSKSYEWWCCCCSTLAALFYVKVCLTNYSWPTLFQSLTSHASLHRNL